MKITLDRLVRNLSDSGLMYGHEATSVCESLSTDARPVDPDVLVQELINAGKLTPYQADCLCQGEASGLTFAAARLLHSNIVTAFGASEHDCTHYRNTAAEDPFRQALAVYEKLAADYPEDCEYRDRNSRAFRYSAENLVEQRKHAEAGQTAVKYAEAFPTDARNLTAAADYLSRCASLASSDSGSAELEREAAV
jgi:hypothetical protein